MKLLPLKALLLSLLFPSICTAAEPNFGGRIEARSRLNGPTVSIVEYLSDGTKLLIRQPGDGFKRASNLIDLETGHYTQIQHHNHSHTPLGRLEDRARLHRLEDFPAPPAPKVPLLAEASETRQLVGQSARLYRLEQNGQRLEIWAISGLPAFYAWQAFAPEPFTSRTLEKACPAILRKKQLFPLLITHHVAGVETPRVLFEVTAIHPAKPNDDKDPALLATSYAIPADHQLMEDPALRPQNPAARNRRYHRPHLSLREISQTDFSTYSD